MNDSKNTTERRDMYPDFVQTHDFVQAYDFVHVHEFPSGSGPQSKRTRVRVFEEEGHLPLVVFSSPEDPRECTVPDVKRIAAEVMLSLYPRQALLARPRTPWFRLIEHLPKSYDAVEWPVSVERRRDKLREVGFGNYRVTVGGRWPVLRPAKALRENADACHGVGRLTFGYPSWGPQLTLEEVEEWTGTKLGGAFGAAS